MNYSITKNFTAMKPRYFILVLAASFLFHTKTTAQDPDPEWAKRNTWFFDNFTKDSLTWEMFRETFIGVAPAPSADFDQIFYDALYKTKLSKPGLCYGMDVMELLILKNGGHMGYCHPPFIYSGVARPDDPVLETAIELTHGNQINHGFLSFCLDVLAVHKLRDGNYAFAKVQEYLAKNDPPIICISASSGGITGDSGHVVVPYAISPLSGGIKKIWVYDPNRSWYVPGGPDGKPWYDAHLNFISVNEATGAWSFGMAGTFGLWFGDPGSGGRIMTAPLSVVGRKDRLPQSLLAEGAYALNTILIYGDIKIDQITDPCNQKQMLNEDGKELEQCEEKRMNNILGFIPLNGGHPAKGTGKTNAYFFRGADPVDIKYRAIGDYRIGMMYHGKYYEVKGNGKGLVQYFRVADLEKQGK